MRCCPRGGRAPPSPFLSYPPASRHCPGGGGGYRVGAQQGWGLVLPRGSWAWEGLVSLLISDLLPEGLQRRGLGLRRGLVTAFLRGHYDPQFIEKHLMPLYLLQVEFCLSALPEF